MSGKIPLVLLPGLLCDAALWQDQIETLSDIAETTVADLSRDDQLGPMAQGVMSEAPESFALAGLSMGGYIALAFARAYPLFLRGLVLVSTKAGADEPEMAAARRETARKVQVGGFGALVQDLAPKMLSAT